MSMVIWRLCKMSSEACCDPMFDVLGHMTYITMHAGNAGYTTSGENMSTD